MSSLEGSLIRENNFDEPSSNSGGNVGKIERIASAIMGGALVGYGIKQRSPLSLSLALLGGGLLYRGVSGECQIYRALGYDTLDKANSRVDRVAREFHVEKSIVINTSPAELYAFWHNLENLPRFMEGLESVTSVGGNRSHWVARGPGGTNFEWDAEIINDKENELIAWRSLSHADVDNAGTVRFEEAAGGRGTRVRVSLNYNAPGGTIGKLVAKLFGKEPGQLVDHNLKRLKQLVETGEIPTTEGQASGRTSETSTRAREYRPSVEGRQSVAEQPLKTREAGAGSGGGTR